MWNYACDIERMKQRWSILTLLHNTVLQRIQFQSNKYFTLICQAKIDGNSRKIYHPDGRKNIEMEERCFGLGNVRWWLWNWAHNKNNTFKGNILWINDYIIFSMHTRRWIWRRIKKKKKKFAHPAHNIITYKYYFSCISEQIWLSDFCLANTFLLVIFMMHQTFVWLRMRKRNREFHPKKN